MIRSQNLKWGCGVRVGVAFKTNKQTNNPQTKNPTLFFFQGFHLEMTENALCPNASDNRSMSSLHQLHFSVSLSATRVSPEKNIEKCQETSQRGDCQMNSLLMKAAHMSKAVRYSEVRAEGQNTHTYSEHFPVRNAN